MTLTAMLSVLSTSLSALSASFRIVLVEPALKGISEDQSLAALKKIEGGGGLVLGQHGQSWDDGLKEWMQS